MTAIAASRQPVSRTPLEEGRAGPDLGSRPMHAAIAPSSKPRIGSANGDGKAGLILLSEMMADAFRQCTSAMLAKVVIEVSEVRHE